MEASVESDDDRDLLVQGESMFDNASGTQSFTYIGYEQGSTTMLRVENDVDGTVHVMAKADVLPLIRAKLGMT